MQVQETIAIRRATPADAAALAEFAARTFEEAFGAANRPEDMAAYLASAYGLEQQTRELSDPNCVAILAFASGRLAAYAQLRRSTPPPCVTGPTRRAVALLRRPAVAGTRACATPDGGD